MTQQDEIIEMARKAGCVEDKHYKGEVIFISKDALERFAKLVEQRKLNEVAAACERFPFGDTAQAFAVWIRQQ
jgi:hypothetical protein